VSEAWGHAFSSGWAWPLLSSFDPKALRAAALAAPHVPRALLLETLKKTDWLQELQQLACVAAVLDERLLDQSLIQHLHTQGLRVCAYTVNDPVRATALKAWGIDGLITDAIDHLNHYCLMNATPGN
jgi:glycerophosphoryl diester phosphodiesterase